MEENHAESQIFFQRTQWKAVRPFQEDDARLGEKYDIEIETISKPGADYNTDEYFELDLPVGPAVMVGDEIVVEGSDVSDQKLEEVICNHLGLPAPEPAKKGILAGFSTDNLLQN